MSFLDLNGDGDVSFGEGAFWAGVAGAIGEDAANARAEEREEEHERLRRRYEDDLAYERRRNRELEDELSERRGGYGVWDDDDDRDDDDDCGDDDDDRDGYEWDDGGCLDLELDPDGADGLHDWPRSADAPGARADGVVSPDPVSPAARDDGAAAAAVAGAVVGGGAPALSTCPAPVPAPMPGAGEMDVMVTLLTDEQAAQWMRARRMPDAEIGLRAAPDGKGAVPVFVDGRDAGVVLLPGDWAACLVGASVVGYRVADLQAGARNGASTAGSGGVPARERVRVTVRVRPRQAPANG